VSIDPAALVLSLGAGVALFALRIGMIPMLVGTCAADLALHLVGVLS
jgi:chromate transporter